MATGIEGPAKQRLGLCHQYSVMYRDFIVCKLRVLSLKLCVCFFKTPKTTWYWGTVDFNNLVVVSGEQPRDSPYIYMYPFSLKPPAHPGWHVTLSRVPCAIQQVLVNIANFQSGAKGVIHSKSQQLRKPGNQMQ